jgi:hypothetical protein
MRGQGGEAESCIEWKKRKKRGAKRSSSHKYRYMPAVQTYTSHPIILQFR